MRIYVTMVSFDTYVFGVDVKFQYGSREMTIKLGGKEQVVTMM
jgi:hypothetical protein